MIFKRDEPCPKCGNRDFAHEVRFVPGAIEALLVPTCLMCKWEAEPRKSA